MHPEITSLAPTVGLTVVPAGRELDLYTAPGFERELRGAVAGSDRAVVVDLSCCEFVDSSALHALLAASRRLRSRGQRLGLVGANKAVLRIFAITGVRPFFDFHDSLDAALAAAARD